MCDFNCENKIMFNKQTNTKHIEQAIRLHICNKMFQSNDLLEEDIVYNYAESVKDVLQVSCLEVKKCKDTFRTNEDFKDHVYDHLEEINNTWLFGKLTWAIGIQHLHFGVK